MRHQHMARIAAIHRDAEMARRGAQILLAVPARRTGAAADPGIHRNFAPSRRRRIRRHIGAGGFDRPGDLVAERERQRPPGRDIEPLVAGELEKAVLHVQVGMAHPAARDPHQYFGAAQCRAFHNGFAQRRPIGDERLAAQVDHR
jgi:hypothetical protein